MIFEKEFKQKKNEISYYYNNTSNNKNKPAIINKTGIDIIKNFVEEFYKIKNKFYMNKIFTFGQSILELYFMLN